MREPKLMNASDLAKFLCISRQTIRNWVIAGKIPPPFRTFAHHNRPGWTLGDADLIASWLDSGGGDPIPMLRESARLRYLDGTPERAAMLGDIKRQVLEQVARELGYKPGMTVAEVEALAAELERVTARKPSEAAIAAQVAREEAADPDASNIVVSARAIVALAAMCDDLL